MNLKFLSFKLAISLIAAFIVFIFSYGVGFATNIVGYVVKSESSNVTLNFFANYDYFSRALPFRYIHQVEALDFVRLELVKEDRLQNRPFLITMPRPFTPTGEYAEISLEEECFTDPGAAIGPPISIGSCYKIDLVENPSYSDLLLLTFALQKLSPQEPKIQIQNLQTLEPEFSDELVLFQDVVMHFDPIWSPDSQKIIYTVWHDGEVHFELLDPITKEKQILESLTGYKIIPPVWSPDSRYLAYASLDEIKVFDTQTNTHQSIGLEDHFQGARSETLLTFDITPGVLTFSQDTNLFVGYLTYNYNPLTETIVLAEEDHSRPLWGANYLDIWEDYAVQRQVKSLDNQWVALIETENGLRQLRLLSMDEFVKTYTAEELWQIIEELRKQIAELEKQLAELIEQSVWCHDFEINLRINDSTAEVRALQIALQKEGFYQRDITGRFDEYTASAVVGFQEKYTNEVLAPWGLARGTGYAGPTTRVKLNAIYGCDVVKPTEVLDEDPYPDIGEPEKWNIYLNHKFEYRINYPLGVFVQVPKFFTDNQNTHFYISPEKSIITVNKRASIKIQIGQNPQYLELPRWVETSPDEVAREARNYMELWKGAKINGQEGLRVASFTPQTVYPPGTPIDQRVHTLIPLAEKVVMISVVGTHKEYDLIKLSEKMLSTFRFIEEDKTVDWQTYRNKEYGFEFKYPSEIYGYPSGEPLEEIIMHEAECLRGKFSYRFDHLNSFYVSVCNQEEKTLKQWAVEDISKMLSDWPDASYNVDDIIEEILLNAKDITVSGKQGIKVFSLPDFRVCSAYPWCLIVKAYFSDNGRIFSFGLYNGGDFTKEKEEFIDQILSTFRFLE